jgi:protoheme IX farnesyltransferase
MLGLGFLGYALRLKREPSDANAMALFKYSILYLFLIFLALGLDAILGGFYG